jgi:thiol-disulfide isomerase/thioredoxin
MKTRRSFLVFLFAALVAAPFLRLSAADAAKSGKPQQISMGKEVALTDYLVPGKTVIFDFNSEYCPPCRAIAPYLEKLNAAHGDVVVVSVDINRPGIKGIDWKSPVARQYKMESIPHFKIYGPNGKLVAEGDPARDKVEQLLQPYLPKS